MLKLFYGAVRDLDTSSISECSILAESSEQAKKLLRSVYNTSHYYYEYEVQEQSSEELSQYKEDYPEDISAGVYDHAPVNHAYLVFR